MMTSILSLSSLLKNVASFTSSLLKTIKSTPFFKIFSLCNALHFQPFFSLEVGRLKLFAYYFVHFSITLECLPPDKVVLLFSLSLACLFTSLFWGLFGGVNTSSMSVSSDIFPNFVFSLCSLLIISTAHNESILQNKIYWL